MYVCVHVELLGGELNMVKISQDHFQAILSIFHFGHVEFTPHPLGNSIWKFFWFFQNWPKMILANFQQVDLPPPHPRNSTFPCQQWPCWKQCCGPSQGHFHNMLQFWWCYLIYICKWVCWVTGANSTWHMTEKCLGTGCSNSHSKVVLGSRTCRGQMGHWGHMVQWPSWILQKYIWSCPRLISLSKLTMMGYDVGELRNWLAPKKTARFLGVAFLLKLALVSLLCPSFNFVLAV